MFLWVRQDLLPALPCLPSPACPVLPHPALSVLPLVLQKQEEDPGALPTGPPLPTSVLNPTNKLLWFLLTAGKSDSPEIPLVTHALMCEAGESQDHPAVAGLTLGVPGPFCTSVP